MTLRLRDLGDEPGELAPATVDVLAHDDLHISRMGVSPGKQGRGIGRALVEHVITRGRDLGLRRCRSDSISTAVARSA